MTNIYYTVYGLSGTDMEIRYIGITRQNVLARMKEHLANARHKKDSDLSIWVNQQDGNLVATELERVFWDEESDKYAQIPMSRERWWIQQAAKSGYRLLNKQKVPRISDKFQVIPLPDGLSILPGLPTSPDKQETIS